MKARIKRIAILVFVLLCFAPMPFVAWVFMKPSGLMENIVFGLFALVLVCVQAFVIFFLSNGYTVVGRLAGAGLSIVGVILYRVAISNVEQPYAYVLPSIVMSIYFFSALVLVSVGRKRVKEAIEVES